MIRGAIAEIDLSAIASNLKVIKDLVKEKEIIAVVKADAYGHGAIEVSKKLIEEGVKYLAVAFTSEAIELRDAGINTNIIVLFDCESIKDFFDYNLIPVVHSVKTARLLAREATKRHRSLGVHIKIDTGMGRLGLCGQDKVTEDILYISKLNGIEVKGLLSHFSEADLADKTYAEKQLNMFLKIKNVVEKKFKKSLFSHIANSAAVISYKGAYLDAVRPGILIYGYSPIMDKVKIDIKPVMRVKTKLLYIRKVKAGQPVSYGRTFVTKRDSKIGVIPVGYADGYNRLLSNNADVIVKGRRVPVVGRICMDLTMVDVTDLKDVKEGEEVVLLGRQGNNFISADELAKRCGTINYEILTSLGSRSRKVYV